MRVRRRQQQAAPKPAHTHAAQPGVCQSQAAPSNSYNSQAVPGQYPHAASSGRSTRSPARSRTALAAAPAHGQGRSVACLSAGQRIGACLAGARPLSRKRSNAEALLHRELSNEPQNPCTHLTSANQVLTQDLVRKEKEQKHKRCRLTSRVLTISTASAPDSSDCSRRPPLPPPLPRPPILLLLPPGPLPPLRPLGLTAAAAAAAAPPLEPVLRASGAKGLAGTRPSLQWQRDRAWGSSHN